jgi:hypothetical protein
MCLSEQSLNPLKLVRFVAAKRLGAPFGINGSGGVGQIRDNDE